MQPQEFLLRQLLMFMTVFKNAKLQICAQNSSLINLELKNVICIKQDVHTQKMVNGTGSKSKHKHQHQLVPSTITISACRLQTNFAEFKNSGLEAVMLEAMQIQSIQTQQRKTCSWKSRCQLSLTLAKDGGSM